MAEKNLETEMKIPRLFNRREAQEAQKRDTNCTN
jgi:hypothetical protein